MKLLFLVSLVFLGLPGVAQQVRDIAGQVRVGAVDETTLR
jgi:hypothetical protein